MQDPLFQSVGSAMVFAFQFRASPRGMSIGEAPIGSGAGLTGLDGAAEAGNIKRMVDDLGKVQAAAMSARFSEKLIDCECCGAPAPAPGWRGACVLLAHEVALPAAGSTCHERLALELTMRHFAMHKRTLAEIAAKYGDGEDKVKKLNGKVVSALRAVESLAGERISERLVEVGLLPSVLEKAA